MPEPEMMPMNGRDAYSEELLSAYLDGEVTDEERRYVEQGLRASPKYRLKLEALRALNSSLEQLGRYRLSSQASARITEAIGGVSVADAESAASLSGEMLEAYFDGQLSAADRARVEEHLQQDVTQQELLDQLGTLQEQIAQLPRYRLDDAFADRVLQRIGTFDRGVVERPATAEERSTRGKGRNGWRRVAWAVAAIAGAALLMFALSPPDDPGIPIARPVAPPDSSIARPDRPPLESLAPAHRPELDVIPPPGAPQPPVDPQWTLVSSIGRNTRTQLVLVYEVSVTEQGVEQAAFANLLRRHRIGFQDTVPVGPKEQADLLKYRFLDDVQVVDQGQPDLDPVELYLVTTTGRTADAIYTDLMGRPEGFGSFFLNLTTREAQDRLLHRLAAASGVDGEVGQAVQLLANFGIFSRTARNVGSFGAIRWVDPSLLEPAPQAEEDEQAVAAGGQAPPAPEADFVCEILFVVRHLRGQ